MWWWQWWRKRGDDSALVASNSTPILRICPACGEVEVDCRCLSRRKFFVLSGKVFVAAAVAAAGLDIAEAAPVVIPKLVYPALGVDKVGALTLSEIDDVLKDIYLPAIRRMLDEESTLMRALAVGDIPVRDGKPLRVPIDIVKNQRKPRSLR